MSSLYGPRDFINYQEARSKYWAELANSAPRFNEHTFKVLAFSCFLCDDIEVGKIYWQKYLESGRHEKIKYLKEEYEVIEQALCNESNSIETILNSWVQENKQKYNIAEKLA